MFESDAKTRGRWISAMMAAVFMVPAATQAQHNTHASCSDPEPFEFLRSLIAKHKGGPGEPDARYLLDLRSFVCAQIATGHLQPIEGTTLFDAEKARIVQKWLRNGDQQAF